MRYQLKQKVFSLTNGYTVGDASGSPIFRIQGKFFSIGHNLSFQSIEGTELAQIRQRLMTLMPKFEIYRGDNHFATVVKDFTWLKAEFTLDIPGPNDYTIVGSFWEYEYEFKRMGRTVATVSKSFWSFTDTYGVDIIDGEDDVSILATVAVIDLCRHESND